jgi:5'-nucleotidase
MRISRLVFLALALGCAVVPPPSRGASPPAGVTVKLIAINDFHGSLAPTETVRVPDPAHPGVMVSEPVGGAAYLATAVRRLEAENPRSIVVGAGDLVGASPLGSALFHDEPTIQALNAIGLAYTSVGNHEFDGGKAELRRKQHGGCRPGGTIGKDTCFIDGTFAGAAYAYLAANVIDDDTGKTLFPPYAIKRIATGAGGSVAIAFIGIVLKDTPTVTTAFGVRGLTFTDEADAINALVPQINAQGVHAIVVLIHQGIATKVGFDDHSCAGASGELLPILDRLDPSIKLVVSGHTHRAYICPSGQGTQHSTVFYTSAGKYGQAVSDIDLTIDPATDTIAHIAAHNELIVNDAAPNPAPSAYPAFTADPAIAALVARYAAATKPLVNRVIGRITGDFTTEGSATASGGSGESTLGDLIADARLEATRAQGAVAAFMNEGGMRSTLHVRALDGSKTPGDVLYGETYAVEPFGDLLYTETVTGAQLYTMLGEQWPHANGAELLSVSRGFHYVWDANLPDGASKVVPGSVTIGGRPVVMTGTYRVTVDAFLIGGGDGFVALAGGADRVAGDIDRDVLDAYITAHSPLTPGPRDRIQRVH